MSVFSVLFTLVLFSELSSRWVTTAMPTSKADDRVEDHLGLLLSDEPISEPASVMHRRSIELDSNIRDDNGSPQILVLTDMQMKGHGLSGLTRAFPRSLPLLTDQNPGHFPRYNMKIDRRDTDLDMLRCMIGRVYRPCWEV